jgi:hypothetical protein
MAADPNASIARLTVLNARETALIESMGENGTALAEIHAERCALLREILAEHGEAIGVDAATLATATATPTDDIDPYSNPA